jgi:hypothetical protein
VTHDRFPSSCKSIHKQQLLFGIVAPTFSIASQQTSLFAGAPIGTTRAAPGWACDQTHSGAANGSNSSFNAQLTPGLRHVCLQAPTKGVSKKGVQRVTPLTSRYTGVPIEQILRRFRFPNEACHVTEAFCGRIVHEWQVESDIMCTVLPAVFRHTSHLWMFIADNSID